MKLANLARIVVLGVLVAILALDAAATDPIFVKWLVVDDPGDETIRTYWQRAEAGELSAEELVDLGTMLFYRGWSNDAIDYFKQALKLDPKMSEAWFRIGLVKHREGDLSGAKSAYKKCLDRQSGHGWANFYLGLLEEQSGNGKAAMNHYETAFKHAPELADPRVNPEILSSELQLGARVRYADGERFEQAMPMRYLDPKSVREVRRQFLPTPTPTTTPTPVAARPAGEAMSATESPAARGRTAGARNPRTGAAAGGGAGTSGRTATGPATGGAGTRGAEAPAGGALPFGVPTPAASGAGAVPSESSRSTQIGDTSPEARLEPLWPGLYDLIEAVV
jgi:hypothetical protein